MKIGIVTENNDLETCGKALLYDNFAFSHGDEVKVFFIGKGVKSQKISREKFSMSIERKSSCRYKSIYDIVKGSDKIATF